MAKSSTENMTNPGFLKELWQQIKLVFLLLKDREVPIYLKILPFLGLAYVIFPIDIISDFIPVLGQLDDITIMIIGAKVFIEMSPSDIVNKYLTKMNLGGDVRIVEGEAADVFHDQKALEETVIIDAQPTKDFD